MTNKKIKDVVYEEKDNKKEVVSVNKESVLYILVTVLSIALAIMCAYEFYLKDNLFSKLNIKTESTNDNRMVSNIKLNEVGLADSVEKIYDSVVIIENYKNNKLYSSGSGFVFKTDDEYGYIITNNHVISESTDIKVTLSNENTVNAKVIGSD